MEPWWQDCYGNPSAIHTIYGRRARDAVEQARAQIAAALQVSSEAVLFTSGATEANNLALKGLIATFPSDAHVITTAIEHRAVLEPLKRLARRRVIELSILPVNAQAEIDLEHFQQAIRPATRLASIQFANNEVGTIFPLSQIHPICQRSGVVLHSDAAQMLGRFPLPLSGPPTDFLSVSAHKCYGPQGIGALIVPSSDSAPRLEPLLEGGGQERRLRSGTVPVALCVGFGAAVELAQREWASDHQHLEALATRLVETLCHGLPDLRLNGPREHRLSGNVSVSFPDIDGMALLQALPELAVSSGAACSTTSPEPSHVLLAMGLDHQLAQATLRLSVGRFNTIDEIDRAAKMVIAAVHDLRRLRQ